MENTESKKMLLSVLGVALLLVAVVGISYAVFMFTSNAKKENVITTGTISMSYTEGLTNVMSMTNAIPITDEVGKKQEEYFDFQISSEIAGSTNIEYQIVARNLTQDQENNTPKIPLINQLGEDQVKIYLEKRNGSQDESVLEPIMFNQLTPLNEDNHSKVLYTGKFVNNSADKVTLTDQFTLRMWLDSKANIDEVSRTFKIRVDILAKTMN